jgi:hypothetical protein
MALYVVYRTPADSTGRSIIPARLKELGCQQVHRAVWKFKEKKARSVMEILEKNQPIVIKRLREIQKPQFAKKKELTGLGSLVVVMFTLPKEANREKVKNFLRKAPCIRLRRSVYAFSLKQNIYEKDQKLVDALKFVNFIKENRGTVKIISRVVVLNTKAVEKLLNETNERIENSVTKIIQSCKELYLKSRSTNDLIFMRDRFARIKRRFIILKKVALVYESWLKLDFSNKIMRTYHALRKVKTVLEQT